MYERPWKREALEQSRIAGLAEQLRNGGLEQQRDQFKQQLTDQFSGLTKGGTEPAVSISFEIGPALGLLNLETASVTVEFKYDFKEFGGDETKIRAKHNFYFGVNVAASGGEVPVDVHVGGNLGLGAALSIPIYSNNCVSNLSDLWLVIRIVLLFPCRLEDMQKTQSFLAGARL